MFATDRFGFFSHPAVNLHHHLIGLTDRYSPTTPLDTSSWSEVERQALEAARSFYSEYLAGRSVILDSELIDLRDRLAWLPAEPPLAATADPPSSAVASAIELVRGALPGYLAHEFPAIDHRHQRWAHELAPLIEEHEQILTTTLAKVWGGTWPQELQAVDLVTWGGPHGAYTTGAGPVTMETAREELTGLRAVETLIHEASHRGGVERPLKDAVSHAFRAEGVEEPTDIWHVALFVGAGEIMRQHLRGRGVDDYDTYPEYVGLWRRIPRWGVMHDALVAPFRRYLAGEIDRQTALRAGVRAYAAAPK